LPVAGVVLHARDQQGHPGRLDEDLAVLFEGDPLAPVLRHAPQPRRHDLRHTGLTWMADAGVPVHVLRKIAGHDSLITTQRYLHPDSQSIAAAGAALSAHLTAMTASWSQSGPKLRLVPGTAGQPSTHKDAS